jgi:hypothetical protein
LDEPGALIGYFAIFRDRQEKKNANKVEFIAKNGKLIPNKGGELEFLLLLDRRLYTLELIAKQPETYQEASRHLAKRAANP